MESRQTIAESQNACPSCRTRLRVALQAGTQTEFVCPECGTELVARSTGKRTLEISAVQKRAALSQPPRSASWRWLLISGNIRTTAVVITVSCGMFLAIILTPPVGEPCLRPGRDARDPAASVDTATVDNSGNSNQPAGGATGSEFEATRARSVVPKRDTGSFSRRHTEAGSENAATSPVDAIRPDSELASTISNEPPIALTLPPLGDEKPARPTGSVQLVAGKEETGRSDPPGQPLGDEKTATADEVKVVTPNLADEKTAEPMNVQARLEISIRSFRQTKPVPLRELIRTVEQMCRVRVDVSAAADEQLETPVTLSLTKTTPSAILAEAGRKSGLRAIVDEDSVRLVSTDE